MTKGGSMKSVLILCALSSTGYCATVSLQEASGDLCPDSSQVSFTSEGDETSLSSDFTGNSLVEAQNDTLTRRRSCTFLLKVEPGEGRTIKDSSFTMKGNYAFGKSGRIFFS